MAKKRAWAMTIVMQLWGALHYSALYSSHREACNPVGWRMHAGVNDEHTVKHEEQRSQIDRTVNGSKNVDECTTFIRPHPCL